jgi:hypothetical protein
VIITVSTGTFGFLQQLHAVAVGKVEVDEEHIRRVLLELAARLFQRDRRC